jgi:DNA-binding CsgD family transcriptional regulator
LQGSVGPLDARHLAATEDDVRQARQAFAAYSPDAPLPPGDDPAALADLLGEDDPDLSHATDIEAVRAHLDELPEREQRILMWRFYGNLTQTQIGDRLGISQMHVFRLLDRALSYLRAQITERHNGPRAGQPRWCPYRMSTTSRTAGRVSRVGWSAGSAKRRTISQRRQQVPEAGPVPGWRTGE